jgi:hypothetical protein
MNEQDITNWLTEQAKGFNWPGLCIMIESAGAATRHVYASAPKSKANIWDKECTLGETIPAAVEELRKMMKTPKQRADELRAQADAIEKEAANGN